MKNIDLVLTPLPAQLIVKNFVVGECNSNYEKYMVEFLNHSSWFRNKVNRNTFEWKKEQDNGECDAYADAYGIDFKLLIAPTYGQAQSEYSSRIAVLANKIITIFPPNRSGFMTAISICEALYDLSIEDLYNIESHHFKKETIEHDIQSIIKYVCKNKNILFVFPYEFSSKESNSMGVLIFHILEMLTHYFLSLFMIRQSRLHDKETYLSCFCLNTILFFQFDNGHFKYLDNVDTTKSEIYTKLQGYGIF